MSEIMTRAALNAKYEIVVGDNLPLSQNLQASIIRSHLAALDEIDRLNAWHRAGDKLPDAGVLVLLAQVSTAMPGGYFRSTVALCCSGKYWSHDSWNGTLPIHPDDLWMDLPAPMPETKVGVDETVGIDSMIYLPNQPSYRCECGCNVFRKSKLNEYRFKCNACGAWHVGGPAPMPAEKEVQK
jgi:hypothetical protein